MWLCGGFGQWGWEVGGVGVGGSGDNRVNRCLPQTGKPMKTRKVIFSQTTQCAKATQPPFRSIMFHSPCSNNVDNE